MNKQELSVETIIQLWKELEITSVDFNFNCGGDSMNDTDIEIHTKNGVITNDIIHDYFDNVVYNKVEFYVNSDGHYQGEFGSVEITLEDEGEGEDFIYNKSAQSEWIEQQTEQVCIKLTDVEIAFLNKNVLNINGDDSNFNVVFNGDVFLNDEDEVFLENLEKKIEVKIRDYSPSINEGELQEYYRFNTHENDLNINEYDEVVFEVHYSVTIYRDSEN